MNFDYTLTEQEFHDRDDQGQNLEPLECSESNCGHYDALNQCCWLSWRQKEEGDICSYGWYVDENGMIVKVSWDKKASAKNGERRTRP